MCERQVPVCVYTRKPGSAITVNQEDTEINSVEVRRHMEEVDPHKAPGLDITSLLVVRVDGDPCQTIGNV